MGSTAGETATAPASTAPAPTAAPSTAALGDALTEVRRVIVGQDAMVERLMIALLARGHCLLEGVPGTAKTLAVRTFAVVVGGDFARLQFTPDLVPSDIVGTRIYRPSKESFDIELGPVFVNFVLADEINRAPAKVQSAMLELMAERQVSIGGQTHAVPAPFIVIATENPIESEGVYPLPEAQRDRFLLKVGVPLPDAEEELAILSRMSVDPPAPSRVLDVDQILGLQRLVDRVFVHRLVADYAVRIVLATRRPAEYGLPDLAAILDVGASPRATLGLIACARAVATLRGREYVLPVDIREIAPEVIAHRLVLSFDAVADGAEPGWVVERILSATPPPRPIWREPGAPDQDGGNPDGGDPAGPDVAGPDVAAPDAARPDFR